MVCENRERCQKYKTLSNERISIALELMSVKEEITYVQEADKRVKDALRSTEKRYQFNPRSQQIAAEATAQRIRNTLGKLEAWKFTPACVLRFQRRRALRYETDAMRYSQILDKEEAERNARALSLVPNGDLLHWENRLIELEYRVRILIEARDKIIREVDGMCYFSYSCVNSLN